MDTNGLWDEMHCTNNVKNYACQIPVGTEGNEYSLPKKHTPFSAQLVFLDSFIFDDDISVIKL